MAELKHYFVLCILIAGLSVGQCQLNGLAKMLAGPRGGMLKMLAHRVPLLQRGLATLQDMKIAKRLGCTNAFDNESPLRTIMPSGCTAEKDICPYVKPTRRCVQVGIIGMCCPYMVSASTIKNAKMMYKWKRLSEVMA
ncbi:hypothetical protein SNE40_016655 [Patella caerulea]|uniref:Uncharacterized protein n=1 Tax=Patella caerulea TaxID=87958 RepID=A0AAN8P8I3_PATCE